MNRAAPFAEALRREVPGVGVELQSIQFDENLTDLEIEGGDRTLYIVVAPFTNSHLVLLDDFRFEDVVDAEVVQILKALHDRKAHDRLVCGIFRRHVLLPFDPAGEEGVAFRTFHGSSLSRCDLSVLRDMPEDDDSRRSCARYRGTTVTEQRIPGARLRRASAVSSEQSSASASAT